MQKNPSVMNNLHKISDKIAESARAPEKSETSQNNGNYMVSPEQMARRYEDYLRARRDLEERVVTLFEKYAEEERQLTSRVQSLQNAQNELQTIYDAVPEPEENKTTFNDRAEAASYMRNVEKRRIEAMRVIASMEQNNNKQEKGGSAENTIMLLESLSFQQIFRIAFASALPFLFWTLLGATIVSLSIVGALKGWF